MVLIGCFILVNKLCWFFIHTFANLIYKSVTFVFDFCCCILNSCKRFPSLWRLVFNCSISSYL